MTKHHASKHRSPRNDERPRNLSALVSAFAQIIRAAVAVKQYFDGC